MLIVETIGRIRREHFVQGKTIREIARDLKLSRNTVRKVLRSAETAFSCGREVRSPMGERFSAAEVGSTNGRPRSAAGEERAGASAVDADPGFSRSCGRSATEADITPSADTRSAGAKRTRVRRRAPSSP